MKINTVLFSRVSTREQADEGYSLSAQEKLLKEYSSRNEFRIVKNFSVPESASGRQERKVFNELLSYLVEHKEIKILVCEKVDRLTRNFKDAVRLDDWINEDPERQVHFVKQGLVLHKESKSHERFQWDMYVALARQYSNNLSEETRKGLDEKAAQGWFPGNQKRGYKSIGDSGHKTWFIDTGSSDHIYIAKAFELYAEGGHTLRTISKQLFKEGWRSKDGKQISISELHNFLTDPFYCGEFLWKGKKYQGKHNLLVSKETFFRVQEILNRPTRAGKYRKHSFLLGSGLLLCGECGRSVTAEVQKGHYYYHCTKHDSSCSQKSYAKQKDLEDQILAMLDKLKIDNPRILEWIRKGLKETHQDEFEYHTNILKDLDSQLLAIEKRLSVIYDDMVDERVSKVFYETKKVEYEKQLEDVQVAKNKHIKADVSFREVGANIFEISQRGREIYEKKFLLEEKKVYLNFIFSNFMLRDKKLVPTFQNGFEVVAKRAEDGNWLGVVDDFRTLGWVERIKFPM